MSDNKAKIIQEILKERTQQDNKWGEQNHPSGTGMDHYKWSLNNARKHYEDADNLKELSWALILLEEVYEALAEKDIKKVREELIQVAAVVLAWIEAIDRRKR